MNYRQIEAIEKANKDRLIEHFGEIPDVSGIYIFTREENGFKYAYIGQAKRILSRILSHLKGFQHIDISIKKHGLKSTINSTGWDLTWVHCNIDLLNEKEQYWIKLCADKGYQLYNHTTGSQGVGKKALGEQKERKGYNQGLNNGYKKAIKDVKNYFDKYLDFVIKGKTNKTKERKLEEFKRWVYEETSEGDC